MLPFLAGVTSAQEMPVVADAEWARFRPHLERLLRGLDAAGGQLPEDSRKKLRALLQTPPKDTSEAVLAAQEILDRHCLIAIHINPESRVKAARGPASASLVHNRPQVFLVKVHNEGAIRHSLAVGGDEFRLKGKAAGGRWLEGAFIAPAPLAANLSGEPVEYVLLRLTARETGKREATLRFDAGQGTQDLGFRAEVPILFRIQTGK
jgi:hypothetical protein